MRQDNEIINVIERGDFIKFGEWEMYVKDIGSEHDRLIITHVETGNTILLPEFCSGWFQRGAGGTTFNFGQT